MAFDFRNDRGGGFKVVYLRVPSKVHDALTSFAHENNSSVNEVGCQMLEHCLAELDDKAKGERHG